MDKHKLDRLQLGVRSLLVKNGYSFSDEDKALLETILVELEEISNNDSGKNQNQIWELLSLVLRFMKFFGVDDLTDLF